MFSILSKIEIIILVTVKLSSDRYSLIHHYEAVPNSKKLQMTTDMWLLKDFKIEIA